MIGSPTTAMLATAAAEPEPAPAPLPGLDVMAMPPISPADYSAMNDIWYAFGAPGGVTCVIDRGGDGYGCSGALPAAPNGANVVSTGNAGPPGFSSSDRPVFGMTEPVNVLPANSRLTYRNVSCGTDGTTTSCVNSYAQSGFVLSPAGSYIFGEVNPLVDRPDGTNPYAN